jgi:hypothetical protein
VGICLLDRVERVLIGLHEGNCSELTRGGVQMAPDEYQMKLLPLLSYYWPSLVGSGGA